MTLTDSQAGTLLLLMCHTNPVNRRLESLDTNKPLLKKDLLTLLEEKGLGARRIGMQILNKLEKCTLKKDELLLIKKKIRANLHSRGFNYYMHEEFPLFGLYQNQALLTKIKGTKLIYLGTLYALLPYAGTLPLKEKKTDLTNLLNKPSSRTLINHLEYLQKYDLLSFEVEGEDISINSISFSVHLSREKTFLPLPSVVKKEKRYIYFLQESISNTVKIGKTKNYLNRINNHGVLLPFKTEVLFVFEVKDHHQTETDLIHLFKNKRIKKTEWFKLDGDDLSSIEQLLLPKNIKKQIIRRVI